MVITKTAVDEVAAPILVSQSVTVRGIYQFNGGNAAAFLQMFNATAAVDVTVGTTVPNVVVAAATLDTTNISGLQWLFPLGLVIAVTATATGNGAPNVDNVVTLDVN